MRRFGLLFLVGLVSWFASSTARASESGKSGPGVLVPADGGERFNPEYGGLLVLKVGPETSGATQVVVGTMDLPAGAGIPTHRHDRDEEVLYVLDGEVAVLLNDRELRARTGDTVFIPVGTWMTVRNAGTGVARLLGIIPRAEMEECLRHLHGKGKASGSAQTHEGIPDVCHLSAPPPTPAK